MTGEHLDAILKTAHCTKDKEGWYTLSDGATMTLHLSHDGASLSVSRVEAVRSDGDLLYARTPKRELYAVVRADVYAIAFDSSAAGQPARRAGFG